METAWIIAAAIIAIIAIGRALQEGLVSDPMYLLLLAIWMAAMRW